jgi:REP element-mobilizing transposase RayT
MNPETNGLNPPPREGPPRNQYLQQLIKGKREWSEPLELAAIKEGFRGWRARGYLPHYDVPGVLQFLTFRLHDAMPTSRRSEWAALMHLEDSLERRKKLERYLDQGQGECWLRRPEVAEVAMQAFRFFDGKRYRLDSWVVMPNHVHLIVEVWHTPLASLVQSWKRHISRESNKLLGRNGPFWEREYWDTHIRDEAHLQRARRYIEANPVKAGLAKVAGEWRWSSASCGKGE